MSFSDLQMQIINLIHKILQLEIPEYLRGINWCSGLKLMFAVVYLTGQIWHLPMTRLEMGNKGFSYFVPEEVQFFATDFEK